MPRNPKIPAYLLDLLPAPARASLLKNPFAPPGGTAPSLRDVSLFPSAGDYARGLTAARERGASFEMRADGGPDSIAAGAILRGILDKLGVPEKPPAQGDLFEPADQAPLAGIDVGGDELRLVFEGKEIRSGLRGSSPPYPFPSLSLPGLALKTVDALFLLGVIGYPDCFVAFDLETTGRDPREDEIIEIGAVKIRRGRETDAFSSLVRPVRDIPGEVEQITGINSDMVRGSPRVREVLPAFLDFCAGEPLIAHNAPFDLAFLRKAAMNSLGVRIANDWEDTLVMSRWLYPGAESHRLGAMAEMHGIQSGGWHRADADARMVAALYVALVGDRGAMRDLRIKEYLPHAALGTVLSGNPCEDENEIIVLHGLAAAVRSFGLSDAASPPAPRKTLSPREMIEGLVSLHDDERREAALNLIARA